MASNPSSRLAENLRGCFPPTDEQDLMDLSYYFSSGPPQCINSRNEYLRYVKYQPRFGEYSFATIQECVTQQEAERHWETQKHYDEGFLIHPKSCIIYRGKYVLVFPEIIRLFKGWIQEHAEGRVTDAVIWEMLKKIIVENMMYLVKSDRPHGNLLEGIGVTPKGQPLFLNLGADTDALIYGRDAQALMKMLKDVESKLRTKSIKDDINKWWSFLNLISSGPSPRYLPHDYNAVHVRFVFNYPSSWDFKNKLRFLRNIYYLCGDRSDSGKYNLMKIAAFRKSLNNHYANWPAKVISLSGVSGMTALKEVYQFGVKKGLYVKQGKNTILTAASIVLFAYNCARHHLGEAQIYNNVHHTDLGQLETEEILSLLFTQFSYLTEHIYEAFYKAVALDGYTHKKFNISQILTEEVLK